MNTRKRYERIKERASLEDNGGVNHWIHNMDSSEFETLEDKLKANRRLTSVTFDGCKCDGFDSGTYAYEYDKSCREVDATWPIGVQKPHKVWDLMNDNRQKHREDQKAGIYFR